MADQNPPAIRPATLDQILPLRHRILRAGLPIESACFAGDDLPQTFHLGAFTPDGTCVGCATLHRNSWQRDPAFQLRGMAVSEGFRGHGIGKDLLKVLEQYAARQSVRWLWCNARTPAVGFYEKQGWQKFGDEFLIPSAGPHFRMFKGI